MYLIIYKEIGRTGWYKSLAEDKKEALEKIDFLRKRGKKKISLNKLIPIKF